MCSSAALVLPPCTCIRRQVDTYLCRSCASVATQVLARQHQLTATQIVSVMQALASLVPTRKTRNPTDWGAFGDSLSTRPVTLFDQSRRVIDMGLSASAFVGVQSRFTEAVGGLLARLGRLCVLRADNQTLGALLACVEVVGSMVLPGTGASPLSDTEVSMHTYH